MKTIYHRFSIFIKWNDRNKTKSIYPFENQYYILQDCIDNFTCTLQKIVDTNFSLEGVYDAYLINENKGYILKSKTKTNYEYDWYINVDLYWYENDELTLLATDVDERNISLSNLINKFSSVALSKL